MTAGNETMRIAVIGAGGVGGSFGAALAKAGADVTFVARGAHVKAMLESGLKVLGLHGDIHLQPTKATDDPATTGPVDFILFCVKLWDVEGAGAAIRALMGPQMPLLKRSATASACLHRERQVTRVWSPQLYQSDRTVIGQAVLTMG